ncbi:hypothetical protein jhhlp_000912 [Lomentospora prolificans]|uniref:Uncharacterized protein n=1 Tax=Lomentospora prolificans TaxID=41688 RepID=A0A2N3NJV6_9PEZI|nr:hypothetical protein jhhlp_000912 [Lomentospora prolificans]
MKGRPIDELVYEYMFPKPRQTDPPNFSAFLQRSLILEVRQEVHSFYGHLDTAEAKYPGLDYCHPIHRIRLSRWPWHRRLFRAFDGLRLTPYEISNLTKWEGTKWAKERYEREQGAPIHDTTADGFPDWVGRGSRAAPLNPAIEEAPSVSSNDAEEMDATLDDVDEVEYDETDETDETLESVGPVLNERLREQIARREAGDTTAVLDEEWEQWLKNALEAGELPDLANAISQGSSTVVDIVPNLSLFPPSMLDAARAGQWHEIPDFLHPMLRRVLLRDPNNGQIPTTTALGAAESAPRQIPTLPSQPSNPLHHQRQFHRHNYRSYSDLRLPSSNPLHRTAEARGS